MAIPQDLLRVELDGGFTLRLADPSQYDEVGRALVAGFNDGCWVTPMYERRLRGIRERAETADVWVAVDAADRVCGAVLTPKPECWHEANYTFNVLGVAPWGRGHGLGRALVRHALALSRAYGYRTVELHSSPQMTHAHELYYRCGFHRRVDWETGVVDSGQRLLSFTWTDATVPVFADTVR